MTLMMRDLENQEMCVEKEQKERIEKMLRRGKTPEETPDLSGWIAGR